MVVVGSFRPSYVAMGDGIGEQLIEFTDQAWR
jgi:hypothetical protein